MERLFADDLRLFNYSFSQWKSREKRKIRDKQRWKAEMAKRRTAGPDEEKESSEMIPYSSYLPIGYAGWLRNSRQRNLTRYSAGARSWMMSTTMETPPRMGHEGLRQQVSRLKEA